MLLFIWDQNHDNVELWIEQNTIRKSATTPPFLGGEFKTRGLIELRPRIMIRVQSGTSHLFNIVVKRGAWSFIIFMHIHNLNHLQASERYINCTVQYATLFIFKYRRDYKQHSITRKSVHCNFCATRTSQNSPISVVQWYLWISFLCTFNEPNVGEMKYLKSIADAIIIHYDMYFQYRRCWGKQHGYLLDEFLLARSVEKLTIFLVDSFANVAISFFKTGMTIQPMTGGKLDDRK